MSNAYNSNIGVSQKVLIGVGVSLIAVGGAGYFLYRHLHRNVMPVKWRRVGTLQQVNVFPVKSCAPIRTEDPVEYDCDVLGIGLGAVRDRKFMLINCNNEMVTANGYPHMLNIRPKQIPTGLLLSAPGMPDLNLDFRHLDAPGKDVHTSIWGVPQDVMLCGELYDKWFSQYILKKESGLKFVYYSYEKPMRPIHPKFRSMPYIKHTDSGAFHDVASYMLMNLSSFADINKRLDRPVDPLRFRGNFEVKMDKDEPYAEDYWQWIRIGDEAVFRVVAPCTRCILPNINSTSSEGDVDRDLLKILLAFRLNDDLLPVMGIHLGLRRPGIVKTNDIVYVEAK